MSNTKEIIQPEFKLNPLTDLAKQLGELLTKDPTIAEGLKKELVRQGVLSRVLLPSARPKGTYYNTHYGKLLAPILDSMIADTTKKYEFLLEKFNSMSLKTLHTLISQAFLYLRESKETDENKRKAYNELWELVVIRQLKDKPQRVVIERLSHHKLMQDLPANEVKATSEAINWKQTLATWLDDPSPNKPRLEILHLSLTAEEVDELDIQLNNIGGCVAVVRHEYIKIVKG